MTAIGLVKVSNRSPLHQRKHDRSSVVTAIAWGNAILLTERLCQRLFWEVRSFFLERRSSFLGKCDRGFGEVRSFFWRCDRFFGESIVNFHQADVLHATPTLLRYERSTIDSFEAPKSMHNRSLSSLPPSSYSPPTQNALANVAGEDETMQPDRQTPDQQNWSDSLSLDYKKDTQNRDFQTSFLHRAIVVKNDQTQMSLPLTPQPFDNIRKYLKMLTNSPL